MIKNIKNNAKPVRSYRLKQIKLDISCFFFCIILNYIIVYFDDLSLSNVSSAALPGRVAQSVGHLTRKSEVLGSIPSLATYFRFSLR